MTMRRYLKGKWELVAAILWVAMLLTGCSWYGGYIRHNLEVRNWFDAYHLYSGYHYYTCGTLEDPRAVLALKPEYTLNSDGWESVAMTADQLKVWVLALKKDPFVEFNTFSDGAQIIDNQGNIAGVYYSVWDFPIIRFSQSKTLLISKPKPIYRYGNEIKGRMFDDDGMFID
jgi:hypothetical protein